MRILWLTNLPLPEVSILMNEKPSPLGGWLIKSSEDLSKLQDIELSIAFPKKGTKDIEKIQGQRIKYYAFKPVRDINKKLINHNSSFINIINEVKPDIVHIYGTELPHTLSMVNMCVKEKIKVVISIQGLVSIISKHTFANLPLRAIYGFTLRNIFAGDNILGLQKLYLRRGKLEIEAIKKVNHIIGRTTWDKACTSQINPAVKYHFCNETLREEFYRHQWNIDECEKYTIFLSQGQYPIKGLHYVLEAMPLILKKFPQAKLYVSGKDITKSDTLKDKLLMTYYGKYIKRMIRKLNLENNIIFTGPLDEKKMSERYLKSNVFICPSTIENSPNSLGEAMILGVPCVASDVGGISDMLKHKEEGFIYQADAPYMLAYYVNEIFENKDLALRFSNNSRKHALNIYDRQTNINKLLDIYGEIIKDSN